MCKTRCVPNDMIWHYVSWCLITVWLGTHHHHHTHLLKSWRIVGLVSSIRCGSKSDEYLAWERLNQGKTQRGQCQFGMWFSKRVWFNFTLILPCLKFYAVGQMWNCKTVQIHYVVRFKPVQIDTENLSFYKAKRKSFNRFTKKRLAPC